MRIKPQIYSCILCIACLSFSCIDRETSVGTGKLLPDRMLRIAGNDQTGTVGTEAYTELTVRVLDETNQPVAKVRVEYSVQYGDASLSDTVATTNFDGNAKTKVTYGKKADSIAIYATVLGLRGSPVIFTLRSVAASASVLTSAGTSLSGSAGSVKQVSVRASDAYDNPVKNAVVSFTAKPGNGSVSNVNVVTDSTGVAKTFWTLDTLIGINRLEATLTGKTTPPVQFTATVTAGDAATLIVLSGGDQFGFVDMPLPEQLQIAAKDMYGNYLSFVSVQFTAIGKRKSIFSNRRDDTQSTPARTRVTITLGAFSGENIVQAAMDAAPLLTFRFNGYAPILLSSPTAVAGTVNLNWEKNLNADFISYTIYRSTAPGITTSSTLLATITDQTITTYVDSTVVVGIKYYYRVYVSFTNGQAFFTNEESVTP